jgi:hypothetical protein
VRAWVLLGTSRHHDGQHCTGAGKCREPAAAPQPVGELSSRAPTRGAQ